MLVSAAIFMVVSLFEEILDAIKFRLLADFIEILPPDSILDETWVTELCEFSDIDAEPSMPMLVFPCFKSNPSFILPIVISVLFCDWLLVFWAEIIEISPPEFKLRSFCDRIFEPVIVVSEVVFILVLSSVVMFDNIMVK